MEVNEVIIPRKDLLNELGLFKKWSGPFLVKILSNSPDFGLRSLGSGGLMKYKKRYFVITNAHVIRYIEEENILNEIVIPHRDKLNKDFIMKIIKAERDNYADIAAMEICPSTIDTMGNHWFITEAYLEYDLNDFIARTNVVLIHGFPGSKTRIDNDNKIVDMETLPYLTYTKDCDVSDDSLTLYTEETGVSELGVSVELPAFDGMSGSFVYGYNKDKIIPYTFLGLLTLWDKVEKTLEITTTSEVIKYLENNFFNQN